VPDLELAFISLFPQQLSGMLNKGILGRAIDDGRISVRIHDLRQSSHHKRGNVDAPPFGPNPGMLLRADVMATAIRSVPDYEQYQLIYLCPKGDRFDQKRAQKLSQERPLKLMLIPGYYEGIDERIFEMFSIQRVSMGDMVLLSGELPALMITEAVARLLPGVIGNEQSLADESISSGLLEAAQYCQPREVEGKTVPDVICSGHHAKIRQYHHEQALRMTLFQRPDLLAQYPVNEQDKAVITKALLKQAEGPVIDKTEPF